MQHYKENKFVETSVFYLLHNNEMNINKINHKQQNKRSLSQIMDNYVCSKLNHLRRTIIDATIILRFRANLFLNMLAPERLFILKSKIHFLKAHVMLPLLFKNVNKPEFRS